VEVLEAQMKARAKAKAVELALAKLATDRGKNLAAAKQRPQSARRPLTAAELQAARILAERRRLEREQTARADGLARRRQDLTDERAAAERRAAEQRAAKAQAKARTLPHERRRGGAVFVGGLFVTDRPAVTREQFQGALRRNEAALRKAIRMLQQVGACLAPQEAVSVSISISVPALLTARMQRSLALTRARCRCRCRYRRHCRLRCRARGRFCCRGRCCAQHPRDRKGRRFSAVAGYITATEFQRGLLHFETLRQIPDLRDLNAMWRFMEARENGQMSFGPFSALDSARHAGGPRSQPEPGGQRERKGSTQRSLRWRTAVLREREKERGQNAPARPRECASANARANHGL
jgi:hypothetical protein